MLINSPLGMKFRRPAMMNGYGYSFSDDPTSAQVGAGVGSGIASLVKGFLPGSTATPGTYVVAPSWWDQQSLGEKILIGGLGFLGVAAGIAYYKKHKKSA